MTWRWLRDRFWPSDKSVLAYRDIALLPDPPEMFDADGRNKRARVSRFSEPDREKLAIRRANVLRRVK
jgi:hypothetical protein